MKKQLLSIITLLMVISLKAQEMPEIVPPSPEAAAFSKFNEVPVTLNNGAANISIPIHTVDLKGIQIPINLSYHTRGVKVEEIASRTGIGWTLSFGGMISRTALGGADDAGPWAYLNQNFGTDIPDNEQTKTAIFNSYCGSDGKLDLESDLFNFTMGNTSGKFFFNQGDIYNPIIQEYDDVKITAQWDQGKIVSFIGKDSAGNTFYFGKSKDGTREYFAEKQIVNTATHNSSPGSGIEYGTNGPELYPRYNSWYLIEVETLYGEKIEFFYEQEVVKYVSKLYDSYIPQSPESPDAWLQGWRPVNEAHKTCLFSIITEKQYQLSEIRYGTLDSNGNLQSSKATKVVFNKEAQSRQDLKDGYALDNIEINDKNNTTIRSFDLSYSYSHNTANTSYLYSLPGNDPESYYRLILDSVQEKDANSNALPPYVFEYNPITLPNRFSTSQDIWGYYNGEDNGSYLTLNPYNLHIQPNREIDTLLSEAAMLKKVTYPTGGYSKFTYEHNRAVPSYNMNEFVTYRINPSRTLHAGIGILDHDAYNGDYYATDIFEIKDIYGHAKFNVSLPDNYGVYGDQNIACADPLNNCVFDIRLQGVNGAPTYHLFAGNTEFEVVPGEYQLIFNPDHYLNWDASPQEYVEGEEFISFSVGITWDESVDDSLIYGPGKRIKRIQFFDSNGKYISKKEYDYKKPDGTSSGVLIGLPDFYAADIFSQSFQFHTGSMAGSKTNIYQANQVAYSHVTEYNSDIGINAGKTEYEFTVVLDGGLFYNYPYHTPNDNEWLRGKNLNTKYYSYNEADDTYSLKKEVSNSYLYADNSDTGLASIQGSFNGFNDIIDRTKTQKYFVKFIPIYSLTIFNNTHGGTDGWSAATAEICDYNGHLIHQKAAGTQDLYQTVETDYLDGGDVIKTTTYSYDYNYHYQPSVVSTVTSDEKPIVQTFTYAQNMLSSSYINSNYTVPSTIEDELDYQNRIVVIETKTHVDKNNNELLESGELISTSKTEHNWFNNNLLPEKILTSKGDDTLEERLTYHAYDDKGNIVEVSKKDGVHVVYIWGYEKSLPIAKIENATLTDVESALAAIHSGIVTIQGKSNVDIDRTTGYSGTEGNLRQKLDELRDALPNALVTTFTYDPIIGVTSITDPKGYIIYYQYDSFNRLEYVKDQNENVLSKTEYSYKN